MVLTHAPATDPPTSPLTDAIGRSGLVDGLTLHRAVSEVEAQRPTSRGDFDRRLGEHLIAAGVLNPWQLDQLKRGRTKFTLGPYRILDSIGRGGMGHVFKGEHELLGRVEAVKVLPRVKSTPEAIAGFRHEMRAQAALDHPNLVRVSYADRDGDTYFLVTEYVPGIDLRRLIRRRGKLTPSQAAWVVSQAAEAIDHAHQRGVVHRDVKPGNLLLTLDGAVKVIDLGLAWSLDAAIDSASVYGEGKIAGTSDYVAPEAIRDPGRVRPESDLYGLGCTLYYAVTGKVPYPGGSHAEKLRRRLREDPMDPRGLAPDAPAEMLSLIRALMAPDPEDRPASAGGVARALGLLAGSDARDGVAKIVNELVRRRGRRDESTGDWSPVQADELPETVGLPLHEVNLPAPSAPVSRRVPSRSRRRRDLAPMLLAGALLALTGAIAALAAWRVLGG